MYHRSSFITDHPHSSLISHLSSSFSSSLYSSLISHHLVTHNLLIHHPFSYHPFSYHPFSYHLSSLIIPSPVISPPRISPLFFLPLITNSLSGSFPASLCEITGLEDLNLSGNSNITGVIPSSIGNLVNLISLAFEKCQIESPLPDQLSTLSSLYRFVAGENRLSGSFPTALCSLESLGYLILFNNAFTGTVPDCINELSLSYMDLSNNQFSGTYPDMPLASGVLTIAQNFFTGTLPAVSSGITAYKVHHNMFEGTLPDSLMSSPYLNYFSANQNSLHGTLPSVIGSSTVLDVLLLQGNNFTGFVPPSICDIGQFNIASNPYLYCDLPTCCTTHCNTLTEHCCGTSCTPPPLIIPSPSPSPSPTIPPPTPSPSPLPLPLSPPSSPRKLQVLSGLLLLVLMSIVALILYRVTRTSDVLERQERYGERSNEGPLLNDPPTPGMVRYGPQERSLLDSEGSSYGSLDLSSESMSRISISMGTQDWRTLLIPANQFDSKLQSALRSLSSSSPSSSLSAAEEEEVGGKKGAKMEGMWEGVHVQLYEIEGIASSEQGAIGDGVRILYHISHPNLLHLYGYVWVDRPTTSRAWLVAEEVSLNLSSLLKDTDRYEEIGVEERVRSARKITSGIDYLHCLRQPILHRRLSPRSVLIEYEAPGMNTKLWGYAFTSHLGICV